MRRKILVPLRGRDTIEVFLPYLDDISQPGMTIIFLVHLGASRFRELTARLLAIQSGVPFTLLVDGFEALNREAKKRSDEQQIQHAGQILRDKGVNIEIKFYSGGLRKMIRKHMQNDSIELVLSTPERNLIMRRLQNFVFALQVAKSSAAIPILLLPPNNQQRRWL